ncbi:Gfo/Idh/MocA family oxidoreductase [Brevibacillus antibioticus]|uniref:Gfo/Idh/MocA family oxidoreductase n=1 Tax=Brevibacillus antibioticus TaxID=2570228 RepID=A0A4V5TQW0_9BACL|nr:Gfo/Idh/MocA family oxidoreductase [Brevibacillus antibioticus]TKI57213.1 Gfo/Idh/MocA family oxidoreductase [Brevibacillus antibioticus]
MNIAVLGTGFGAYHAHLLKKMNGVDRLVVFGRNESKLQKLQEELNVEITKHMDEIMRDPTIDVVDICLPSQLHRQFAVGALENGKHVFCETPVCYTPDDAQAMKHARDRSGKKLLVNQFIKFDPAYAYLRSAQTENKYGQLLSLSLKRETAPLWGDLGLSSITTNLMIHELDFVTWLFGRNTNMSAWGTESSDKKQSIVHSHFHYPDAHAEIVSSSQMPTSYPFTVGYEAYFEKAKLVFQEADNQCKTESFLVEYTSSGKYELVLEPVNPYEESLRHAIQCFTDNTQSIIDVDHAVESLVLALALQKQLVRQ